MNVKAGDLAIIIKANVRENIGSIVRVHDFLGVDPQYGPCWTTCTGRPTKGFSRTFGCVVDVAPNEKVFTPDDWMRPISGLPDADTTDTDQPIKIEEPA